MAKLRVHNLAMSLDGFVAGPDQSLENPLGVRGPALHEWVFQTRSGREMIGADDGETGMDEDFIALGTEGIGATIMGRNMFGPIRGAWPDAEWKGWWGDNPPYHHPVFVLTHHARDSIEMAGGTTFHFVTDGIRSALQQAFQAADGQDVRLGGGAATVRAYLREGLVDELHLAVVPTVIGAGERIFDGPLEGYESVELVSSPRVAHVRMARTVT
jgi:dihydrofolate reductase